VNSSHDSARIGDAPLGGASKTAAATAARVSRIIAQSQVRARVTSADYFGNRSIGKQYFGIRSTGVLAYWAAGGGGTF